MGTATVSAHQRTFTLPRLPMEVVVQGLPYSEVKKLCSLLDLSIEELCRLLPISRRTLSRNRDKTLDPRISDHLMMIERVFHRAIEVLESSDNARIWLKSPNYAFRNQCPLDFLGTFTGAQELLDELGRLQHGIFV